MSALNPADASSLPVGAVLSALMTEDYLEALARQGDRAAFDRVLADVPAVPPDPWDRWDEPDPAGPGRERTQKTHAADPE